LRYSIVRTLALRSCRVRRKVMQATVTEIASNVFRISIHPEFGIQVNQFLVADEEPFIMHTGMKKMFPTTLVESS